MNTNPIIRLFSNSRHRHLRASRLVGVGEPLSHMGKACHTVAWFLVGDKWYLLIDREF